jgi:hypothetical protein
VTARHAIAALALLATFAFMSTAHAQTWSETGDAGNLIATAQTTLGAGAIMQITGTLPLSDDVDLYCIKLTSVQPAGTPFVQLGCFGNQSPNIWLFDAAGNGVFTNETCAFGNKTLLAPSVSLLPGTYYVGVSYYNRNAVSAGGNIWIPGVPGQRTPDGPGASGPLVGWLGIVIMNPPNAYTINLIGFGACSGATPVARSNWGSVKSYYR